MTERSRVSTSRLCEDSSNAIRKDIFVCVRFEFPLMRNNHEHAVQVFFRLKQTVGLCLPPLRPRDARLCDQSGMGQCALQLLMASTQELLFSSNSYDLRHDT